MVRINQEAGFNVSLFFHLHSLLLYLIGYGLLFWFDWQIAICVAVIHWGQNCQCRADRERAVPSIPVSELPDSVKPSPKPRSMLDGDRPVRPSPLRSQVLTQADQDEMMR